MRFSDYEWLAAIIASHPGKQLVGRTRLQKEVKLLQRLGLPTSYGFSIHYYGPYSEDLQANIGLLTEFGLVSEKEEFNQTGEPYYVFRSMGDAELPDVSRFQAAINTMANTDSTVLELAATYEAFREMGADHNEAIERLRRKKGSKCGEGREEKALTLLDELNSLNDLVPA